MDHRKIVRDALIHHGFSPEGADGLIANYEASVLNQSDHSTYRELADDIHAMIESHSSAAAIEEILGDDATEPLVIRTYLRWLPSLIRHAVAEEIRKAWIRTRVPGQWPFASRLADELDPFEDNGRGLRSKFTGEPVPTGMVKQEIDV